MLTWPPCWPMPRQPGGNIALPLSLSLNPSPIPESPDIAFHPLYSLFSTVINGLQAGWLSHLAPQFCDWHFSHTQNVTLICKCTHTRLFLTHTTASCPCLNCGWTLASLRTNGQLHRHHLHERPVVRCDRVQLVRGDMRRRCAQRWTLVWALAAGRTTGPFGLHRHGVGFRRSGDVGGCCPPDLGMLATLTLEVWHSRFSGRPRRHHRQRCHRRRRRHHRLHHHHRHRHHQKVRKQGR